MPITPTNISKNTISPSGVTKSGIFLLLENGSFLLQESGFKLMLDNLNYGISAVNQSKNAITPTGITKN